MTTSVTLTELELRQAVKEYMENRGYIIKETGPMYMSFVHYAPAGPDPSYTQVEVKYVSLKENKEKDNHE